MVRFFVRNASTVLLLVLSILVFGTLAYRSLPRESFPDVQIPVVLVSTPYIGVSPEDVESLITIPIENELAGVKDLKTMKSTSAEGVSIISLEFEPEVDIEEALQKVRDGVNRAKPDLPQDAEDPTVQEISLDNMPIMLIDMAGTQDQEVLKDLADNLKDELKRIPGVLNVKVAGGTERQIRVQIDPARLASYGLSLNDVSSAIGNENVNIPGGEVQADASTFLLRVPGELKSAQDVEGVAIKRIGDRPVYVRDVGRVIDGYADRQTYARMNGQPTLSISLTKRAGSNLLEIADQAKATTAKAAETWPAGVSYRVLSDQSENVAKQVSELENNILTALILVVGVLVFSLGWRTSLFVAIAIPLSMLASFLVLQVAGITLNMVVLFALILALGMLVDNGIVVVENVYRHMEEGKDIVSASIDGTMEVAMPVAASTATTVAAFFPLVFWTGIMGQFMGFLPKTVIIVLTSSLVVAVVVLPVATSIFMKRSDAAAMAPADETNLTIPETQGIMRRYQGLLEWSIAHRYLSAGLGIVTFVLTMGIYMVFNHGTEFFPTTEPDRATIAVRAPDGTDVEETDRIVRRIEALLSQEDNVDVYVAESGVSGGGSPFEGAQAASNQARVSVDFLPHKNDADPGEKPRHESTFDNIDRLREALAQIPGAEITVAPERRGPPVGKPISVEVSGDDFHVVGAEAAELRRQLASIPGATDLKDDYRVGRPEMRLRIDRGAAKRVGASTIAVANDVRTAVAGSVASTMRDGTDDYDIMVELDPRYRSDLQSVLGLRIAGREDTSPKTFAVPLSTVASYQLAGGSGSIRHVDQRLVVTIEGDVIPGFNENAVRGTVSDKLDQIMSSGSLPPGVSLRLGGANDEQRNAQEFLGRAFLIGVALIALVLVSQFNRFSTMFIIMFTVVLSLIGVLWGLLLTGTPFGIIMTGIGVISLAGVVVNNAIVLIDYINQLRERGMTSHDAVVRAGITRFRPVMLTAVTTVLGLVPMALGMTIDFGRMRVLMGGPSSGFWGPMAVAVIFGLTFATLLTLVMVPTFYTIREDIGGWLVARFRKAPTPVTVTVAKVLLAGILVASARSAPAQAAPVTLDQAWQAAEGANLNLSQLHEQTIQAESQRGQAWSLVGPRLSTQASYTINQYETVLDFSQMIPADLLALLGDSFSSDPIVIQKKRAFAGSATVVQPIFNGEALPLLSGAYKNLRATRLDETAHRQQVRAGVSQAFYGLAVARQGEALAQAASKAAQDHLELARRQVEAGMAPERAMIQARLSLSQSAREVAGAHAQVVSAQEAFAMATGLDRDSEPVLPEGGMSVPPSVDAALADALQARPDLRAAELRADVARLSRSSKQLGFLPSLDARLTESYSDNAGFTGQNWIWMASLNANWTLWDGGLRAAQLKAVGSQMRMADIAAQQQQQQVEQSVRNAWEQLQRAQQAVDAVSGEVQLAEENLRLAERAFQAGTATWLEVSDAQLGLDQARMSQLQERMNRDLATVQLHVAVGDL